MAQSDKFRIEVFPLKGDGTDGCWRWGFRRIERAVTTLKATKVENRNRWNISYRVYLEKDGQERVSKPKSVWIGPEFSTDAATKALKGLIPDLYTFTPKPVDLLKVIAQQSLDEDDLCLDFFSGSGTTGQAVLELNNQDGGNRKFILVQLPEPTERKDFPTIADITKERVRRVIQKISREDAESAKEEAEANTLNLGGLAPSREAKQDLGFKVFKLQGSNFKTWNADVAKDAAAVEAQMEMHIRHIVDGRTQEDLLYEILLKSGFPLTTPIETLTLAGKTVFSTGTMLVCLEKKLTPEVIKEMAARKPERVVCLDEGFAGNDQLKTNAVQTMKTKGVISFKTV